MLEIISDERRKQASAAMLYWRRGGDSFTCHLFILFQKADAMNQRRLAQAFPHEFCIYSEWFQAQDEKEFLTNLERELYGNQH